MKFPLKVNDRVMAMNGPEHKGTVTKVDVFEGVGGFHVHWDSQPDEKSTPYPASFANKHIKLMESVFKNKNNPNLAFKESKRRKPK